MSTHARTKELAVWMSVEDAAGILGIHPITLRRTIERHARLQSDGSVTSSMDGIRARKLQRRWRVALDGAWLPPVA
jgi:hypothetical protein